MSAKTKRLDAWPQVLIGLLIIVVFFLALFLNDLSHALQESSYPQTINPASFDLDVQEI